jgi:hypothetical protein
MSDGNDGAGQSDYGKRRLASLGERSIASTNPLVVNAYPTTTPQQELLEIFVEACISKVLLDDVRNISR